MGAAVKFAAAMLLAAMVAWIAPQHELRAERSPSGALFAQSVKQRLARDFDRAGLSYLLTDLAHEDVLAYRWQDLNRPVAVGSLVKPFTAMAYGQGHEFHYPRHRCMAGQCWLPQGHGDQDLVAALANSCNSYFRALAGAVSVGQILAVTREFQIAEPQRVDAGTLIGVGREWMISPLALAHAYAELARRRGQPGVGEIFAGMSLSARQGTGAEVGRRTLSSALVKTGTAPCSHSPRGPADGFVVALFPAESPRLLLLLRVHGVTGAQAAVTAGQMLHTIEEHTAGGR